MEKSILHRKSLSVSYAVKEVFDSLPNLIVKISKVYPGYRKIINVQRCYYANYRSNLVNGAMPRLGDFRPVQISLQPLRRHLNMPTYLMSI